MDYRSGNLPPRHGPPRRAETLPVRFAGIGSTERIVRRQREPSIERERDVIIEPISRRQSSLRGEIHRTRAVPIETDRHLSPPAPRRPRRQRSRQRRRQRKKRDRDDPYASRNDISESEVDFRKYDSDSSESGDSSDVSNQYFFGRRRHHLPQQIIRDGYSSSGNDSEEESDVNRDAYAFSLPRYSRSPLSQGSTLMGSDPSINSESHVAANGLKLGMAHYVYRSKYTGEGSIGGSQSAQLTVIHDPKRGRPPLFRWM